jgi:Tfp pilus assembly protein PilV
MEPTVKRQQIGTTLVEALVALLVMALGMLAVLGLQGHLRASGEQAKQRTEAGRLLVDEVERLRSAEAPTRTPSLPPDALAFDEIVSATRTVEAAQTTFTLTRSVQPAGPTAVSVLLEVRWEDRQNDGADAHKLTWRTLLPRPDAALQASLATGPAGGAAIGLPNGVHPALPAQAVPLDPEHSAFKPVESGGIAWILHSASARITHSCVTTQASSALKASDIAGCTPLPIAAWLLSGHVHTSLGTPPDAAQPADSAPAFGVLLTLTSAPHLTPPLCFVDAERNKAKGLKAIDYHCAIVPRSPTSQDPRPSWSGWLQLTGLPLAAGGVRVCRYSADHDGDGSIGNAEHPAQYQKVFGTLTQQNHLLVRFEENCPAAGPATVPHQP